MGDIDMDLDIELDVDTDGHLGSLKRFESQLGYVNGIEEVMVLTLIILK